MIFNDKTLHEYIQNGFIEIDPIGNLDVQVQPAGIDLRLDKEFMSYQDGDFPIDCSTDEAMEHLEVEKEDDYLALPPREFILGSTIEKVSLPDDVAGWIVGRSSITRLGIHVHCAGIVEPGYEGHITLGFFNFNHREVRLWYGMRIAKLVIFELTGPALKPYGHPDRSHKYQNQHGVTGSRIQLEVEDG